MALGLAVRKVFIGFFYIAIFVNCSWVDTRWQ